MSNKEFILWKEKKKKLNKKMDKWREGYFCKNNCDEWIKWKFCRHLRTTRAKRFSGELDELLERLIALNKLH